MSSRISGLVKNIESLEASNGNLYFKFTVKSSTEDDTPDETLLYGWYNNNELMKQLSIDRIQGKISVLYIL